MLLLSGQRGQTLHLLDIRNMTVSDLTVSFRTADPLKTSRPGHHLSELVFTVYPTDKLVCVVITIVDYLDCTSALRDPLKLPGHHHLQGWMVPGIHLYQVLQPSLQHSSTFFKGYSVMNCDLYPVQPLGFFLFLYFCYLGFGMGNIECYSSSCFPYLLLGWHNRFEEPL